MLKAIFYTIVILFAIGGLYASGDHRRIYQGPQASDVVDEYGNPVAGLGPNSFIAREWQRDDKIGAQTAEIERLTAALRQSENERFAQQAQAGGTISLRNERSALEAGLRQIAAQTTEIERLTAALRQSENERFAQEAEAGGLIRSLRDQQSVLEARVAQQNAEIDLLRTTHDNERRASHSELQRIRSLLIDQRAASHPEPQQPTASPVASAAISVPRPRSVASSANASILATTAAASVRAHVSAPQQAAAASGVAAMSAPCLHSVASSSRPPVLAASGSASTRSLQQAIAPSPAALLAAALSTEDRSAAASSVLQQQANPSEYDLAMQQRRGIRIEQLKGDLARLDAKVKQLVDLRSFASNVTYSLMDASKQPQDVFAESERLLVAKERLFAESVQLLNASLQERYKQHQENIVIEAMRREEVLKNQQIKGIIQLLKGMRSEVQERTLSRLEKDASLSFDELQLVRSQIAQ